MKKDTNKKQEIVDNNAKNKKQESSDKKVVYKQDVTEKKTINNLTTEKKTAVKTCPHCEKTKERGEKEYKDLINRLNRIEGQIRGIKGMVEKDAYCPEIIMQVAAANAALNSFNKVLLSNHIKTCVRGDVASGNEETLDELVGLLQKLMK